MRQNCSLADAVPALFLISCRRKVLGFLVVFFFQHFQPVDDGADRADQIVADPRAQQCGEIERFDGRSGHGLVSAWHAGYVTEPANRRPVWLKALIHRAFASAKRPATVAINEMTPSASAEIGPQQAGRLLDGLSEIVARAAAAIMATPFSEVARRSKSDQSPVTAADLEAERIIVEGLGRLLPGLAVIAEESVARAPAELGASYAIVDPLDGTKEFLAGRDEFTVNLGDRHRRRRR